MSEPIRTRGAFWRLFGASSRTTPPPPQAVQQEPQPQVIAPEPFFARALPTLHELDAILQQLRSLSFAGLVDGSATPEDLMLLQHEHALCTQGLGDILSAPSPPTAARRDGPIAESLRRVLALNATAADFSDSQRAAMAAFYPKLMVVLQAILMHLFVVSPDAKPSVVHLWRTTLGGLDTVRIVLVHADELGIIELGDAPKLWREFIKQSVDEIQRCLANVHRAESSVVSLKTQLSMRDHAMDDLRRQFDSSALELELVEGQRACAREALRNVTSVVSMLSAAPPPPPPPSAPSRPQTLTSFFNNGNSSAPLQPQQ